MRVLVSRLDPLSVSKKDENAASGLAVSPSLSRLDSLTNGLLSRALAHGIFFEIDNLKKNPGPWCYVRPRYQKFSSLMIWTRNGKIDWDTLLKLHASSEIVLDSESISAAEQREVEKIFPEGKVKLWPKRGDND
jgi:hypothetical protein